MPKVPKIVEWAIPPRQPSSALEAEIDSVVIPSDNQIALLGIGAKTATKYQQFRDMFFEWLRRRKLTTPIEVKTLLLYFGWMVWLCYSANYVQGMMSHLIDHLVMNSLLKESNLVVYQLVLLRKKVNRALILRDPAKAKLIWRLDMEKWEAALTHILRLWLALGLRADSLIQVTKADVSDLPAASMAQIVVEHDKSVKMRGRIVKLACTCSRSDFCVPVVKKEMGGLCAIHPGIDKIPLEPLILGKLLREKSLSLHSVRRTTSMVMRCAVVESYADFKLSRFLQMMGWESSGAMWSSYTEDYNKDTHMVSKLPNPIPMLLSVGCTLEKQVKGKKTQVRWVPGEKVDGADLASKYKFTIKKRSAKEWQEMNKVRWKLVKEETAQAIMDQCDMGVQIGGYNPAKENSKEQKWQKALEAADTLGTEALEQDDWDMLGFEAELLEEIGMNDDDI